MNPVTFVILSFEGPDPYSRAGGLGSRVSELAEALAILGFETHLFFVGDPGRPGHEISPDGRLHLHRWCQWISRNRPAGVYDGEEAKVDDWNRSLPGWMENELLGPKISAGGSVVVLAEEWHTSGSVMALAEIRYRRGWSGRLHLLWNANNTFSFHRLDWQGLARSATLTTVSRFMKHTMWKYGVDPRVIPNGISKEWLQPIDVPPRKSLPASLRDRLKLVKVARWDPDKRWHMAIGAVARLKRLGLQPVLLARGGMENHRHEVLASAERFGLQWVPVYLPGPAWEDLTGVLEPTSFADIILFETHLSAPQRRGLFRAADAVLANSGIEPFGLVGLEAMACGGIALVGSTGEDYVTPGHDAISLQTDDSEEIVQQLIRLQRSPQEAGRMRRAAKGTARKYTWEAVIRRCLLPDLELRGLEVEPPVQEETEEARPERRRPLPLSPLTAQPIRWKSQRPSPSTSI